MREIGEELGISANTVKNHLVKALKFFREYLKTLRCAHCPYYYEFPGATTMGAINFFTRVV